MPEIIGQDLEERSKEEKWKIGRKGDKENAKGGRMKEEEEKVERKKKRKRKEGKNERK